MTVRVDILNPNQRILLVEVDAVLFEYPEEIVFQSKNHFFCNLCLSLRRTDCFDLDCDCQADVASRVSNRDKIDIRGGAKRMILSTHSMRQRHRQFMSQSHSLIRSQLNDVRVVIEIILRHSKPPSTQKEHLLLMVTHL